VTFWNKVKNIGLSFSAGFIAGFLVGRFVDAKNNISVIDSDIDNANTDIQHTSGRIIGNVGDIEDGISASGEGIGLVENGAGTIGEGIKRLEGIILRLSESSRKEK